MTEFQQSVYDYVRTIPKGEVRTYGEVASAIGKPGAARAVGTTLSKNFDPAIPCHRVVRSDGTLGEYNRGREAKQEMLAREGYVR